MTRKVQSNLHKTSSSEDSWDFASMIKYGVGPVSRCYVSFVRNGGDSKFEWRFILENNLRSVAVEYVGTRPKERKLLVLPKILGTSPPPSVFTKIKV